MKKLFTYSIVAAMLGVSALSASAEQVALFNFTFDQAAVGTDYNFDMSATNGLKVQVDWGNGKLSSAVTVNSNDDGYGDNTKLSGKIAGTTITVYGETPEDVQRLEVSYQAAFNENQKVKTIDVSKLSGLVELTVNTNNIESLDISNCTKLQKLTANNNALATLKLPATETLTTIDVNNTTNTTAGTVTQGTNHVIGSKWSNCPKLQYLQLNGNDCNVYSGWIKPTLDLSKNTELLTLNVNCCNLTALDVKACTKLKTFNAQWNKLSDLDLSNLDLATTGDGKVIAMLNHNQLKSIKLPDVSKNRLMRLNLSYNNFVFSTLPPTACVKSAANFVYSPQAAVKNILNAENIVDLSGYAKVGDTDSEFSWEAILDGATTAVELSADNHYNVTSPGVFRFNVPVRDLTGKITNGTYPKLTLSTTPATSVGLLENMLTMDVKYSAGADGISIALVDFAGQDVYVDWGDGVFAGPYELEAVDNYDRVVSAIGEKESVLPKVKGSKVIVKGNPATLTAVCVDGTYKDGKATSAQITGIDLGKLIGLKKVSLNNNELTALSLDNNPEVIKLSLRANKLSAFDINLAKLTYLELSNQYSGASKTFGDNKIASLDLKKLPALQNLYANFVGLTPNLADAKNLTLLSLIGNEITDLKITSDKLTRLTLNYNELTTFDGSGITSSTIDMFLLNNKLGATPVKLPAKAKNVNLNNNAFTFATLPAVSSVSGTLTYNLQAPVQVEEVNGKVDLSAQANVNGVETVFKWTDSANADIPATDFTNAAGVFTFSKNYGGAVCAMTNTAFPKLTLKTVPVNIQGSGSGVESIDADENAEVVYYNLQGVKVSGNEPGIYIRRQGNKTEKVIVR